MCAVNWHLFTKSDWFFLFRKHHFSSVFVFIESYLSSPRPFVVSSVILGMPNLLDASVITWAGSHSAAVTQLLVICPRSMSEEVSVEKRVYVKWATHWPCQRTCRQHTNLHTWARACARLLPRVLLPCDIFNVSVLLGFFFSFTKQIFFLSCLHEFIVTVCPLFSLPFYPEMQSVK